MIFWPETLVENENLFVQLNHPGSSRSYQSSGILLRTFVKQEMMVIRAETQWILQSKSDQQSRTLLSSNIPWQYIIWSQIPVDIPNHKWNCPDNSMERHTCHATRNEPSSTESTSMPDPIRRCRGMKTTLLIKSCGAIGWLIAPGKPSTLILPQSWKRTTEWLGYSSRNFLALKNTGINMMWLATIL